MTADLRLPPTDPDPSDHQASRGAVERPDSREFFFAAVQMSRMAMCLTDPNQENDPIVFCNPAFERLTGYTAHEVIGRNCRFLQGSDTDQAAIGRIRAGLKDRQDIHEELFNYRKDGTGFWNALFISPVMGADGTLLYFFASQLDVTNRHLAEASLRHAQRLEAIGTMASGVAHEFNNLLTVVLGSLSQLERGMPEGSRDRQRLDRAKWAVGQAERLTQQMLSFARRQLHDNQVVDVNTLLKRFDGILQQVAGGGIDLALDLAADPLVVELDAGQLEMALINLVRNARDAMPDGGPIVVRTGRRSAGPGQAGTEVEIAVQDAGTGMPPDVARRAMEPFFTTKPEGAGTGLGLSMVSGFASQSHGSLTIDPAPARGTVVTLRFPEHGPDAA